MPSFIIHNTIFTGKFLIHEPQLSSTNEFAKKLLSKTKPIDGTVIITDEQTDGKGQGNNVWKIEKNKNLTFSIIYNTKFLLANHQFYISMAIALGVYEAVVSKLAAQKQIYIKWPNDLICEEKKIGGILIENTIFGNYLKNSIIGIGINLNQIQFPDLPNATSLYLITNEIFDLNEVLNNVCERIERYFLILRKGNFSEILSQYNQRLYKKDQTVLFNEDEIVFKGIVKAVNGTGQIGLIVDNELRYFNHGTIKWLK